MRISIDQQVLENVLGYMVNQPYKEVAPLLAAVQQDVKPIKEEVMTPVPNTPYLNLL